jgi:hypothetical protein
MGEFELECEVLAEEDAPAEAGQGVRALPLRYQEPAPLVLRGEVRAAAIAAAGGALAGVATVAAVRAVGSRKRLPRRPFRRRERPANVLASRSFLVDVHLLGR